MWPYIGPKKSTCKRLKGCGGLTHGERGARGDDGLSWIQISHGAIIFSIALSIPENQNHRASAFVLTIPKCDLSYHNNEFKASNENGVLHR